MNKHKRNGGGKLSGVRVGSCCGAGASVAAAALVLTVLVTCGCVRRTMTITTDPPNARVFLNGHELGVSKVMTDFTWYGDYDVVIRKEGYETLHSNWKIDAPWYQWIPIDFFTEVLWPSEFHDQRSRNFVMEEAETPQIEELVDRARDARKRALDPRK